jgi:hypothetical protein
MDACGYFFPARSKWTARTSAWSGVTMRASLRHRPTQGHHLCGRLRVCQVEFPAELELPQRDGGKEREERERRERGTPREEGVK